MGPICKQREGREDRVRQREEGKRGGEFCPSQTLKGSAAPEDVYVSPTISHNNRGHHTYSALLRARYGEIGDNIIER